MSVATKDDVVAALEDKELPLSDLRELVGDASLGRAWAGGFIEFGQPGYCIQGPNLGENSVLIFEGGVSWGGPKTPSHKNFSGILKDLERQPVCGRYERADLPMVEKIDPKSGNKSYSRPTVKEAEARELIGLRVRLTDKGLASME